MGGNRQSFRQGFRQSSGKTGCADASRPWLARSAAVLFYGYPDPGQGPGAQAGEFQIQYTARVLSGTVRPDDHLGGWRREDLFHDRWRRTSAGSFSNLRRSDPDPDNDHPSGCRLQRGDDGDASGDSHLSLRVGRAQANRRGRSRHLGHQPPRPGRSGRLRDGSGHRPAPGLSRGVARRSPW